jgi:hypothetical protein
MDSLFNKKEEPRFGFRYGGGMEGGKKYVKRNIHRNIDIDVIEEKLENLKREYDIYTEPSSRTEHSSIVLDILPSSKSTSRNDDDLNTYTIYDDDSFEITTKTDLDDDDSVITIGVNEHYNKGNGKGKGKGKSGDIKLINMIEREYKELHIKDLDIDADLKKILTMDPKYYNMYQYQLDEPSDMTDIIDGTYDTYDTEIIDEFYINELNPIKKTDTELLMEYENQEKIEDSINSLNSGNFEKIAKSSVKMPKTSKTLKRRIKRRSTSPMRTTITKRKNKYGGAPYQGKNPKPQEYPGKNPKPYQAKPYQDKDKDKDKDKKPVDMVLLEKERTRFGAFLDEITLKTESGILPLLRIFEDPEENILACIYYGFYMKLAANFYDNKYMVKLSKIDATISDSYVSYKRETPSLLIYQNLKIAMGKANMGVVSKLTPRIINAFI